MIKMFEEIGEKDFELVGGKGYNLGMMYNNNMMVPNGYVILSTAYDQFGKGDSMDPDLEKAIYERFDTLGSEKVAVRSSSTVEDLPGMSFAGQYSTYLEVTREDLISRVIDCWKSLDNERAIDYRKQNNIRSGYSHAVVIQTMVDASVAGILFTANPVSGLRDEVVINSAHGLGEAIVSGEVNPDQYIVNSVTGELVEETLYEKSLDRSMISELLKVAKVSQGYFGRPQDMEFAFNKEGKLFIVQSRDITTLFPIEALEHDDKLRAYMSAGTVLFGMKEPFTPMGFDIMSHMIPTVINVMTSRVKKPLTNSFVKYEAGRMYVDMTYLMASRFVAKKFADAFSGNDLPLKGVMYNVIGQYGKTMTKQGIHFRLPLGFFKYGFSLVSKVRQVNKVANSERYDKLRKLGKESYDQQLKVLAELKSDEERLLFAKEVLVEAFRLSQIQSLYCLDVNNLPKIEKAFKKYFGDKYRAEVLIQSLPGCFTQTMMLELNEYASELNKAGRRPSVDDDQFREILAIYGHRGTMELDLGTPRWREDPQYLLDLVESYLVDDMFERNLEDHRNKRIEAETMIEDIYQELRGMGKEGAAKKLKKLMINYRYGVAMREYPKSDIVNHMELGRRALQEVGQNYVDLGRLRSIEDIFFLHQSQVLAKGNWQSMADANRAMYEKEMKRISVPRILMNNGASYYSSTVIDPKSKVLQGLPLSVGTYEGVIRVVNDPNTSQLIEGEILVTESTNPAWTPLFATAGALIMEYGGPMSHGGIVAREYGIPAVVGIASVTDFLKDGQRVRVNGETGLVELLEEKS